MIEAHPNVEAWNDLCAAVYARSKDTPARTWWEAEAMHPALFRALRIDRAEFAAPYAAHPFRLARIEGKAVVLAAHPAPRILGPVDDDWLGIETVIVWNPVDDTATVPGDPVPQLVGALSDDAPALHASPFAFFRAWLEQRAAFAMLRSTMVGKDWAVRPTERTHAPGALMIGTPEQIRWNPSALPQHIECHGTDAKRVNSAIFRAAKLPRVTMRAAA